ncbi:GntR family transcriptional regulator [Halomonas sp. LR5S13]|uniref:FadR/GntR family transcriptional regulator n=1 Tax=Halomonas rhizosphaerae TaxID=3043296 RepID=UPI0024A86445|nr:FCD domain-containing protein [Halomonas rhizosphaerae]MDI5922868.1 GntR family transcriptional regulator [Halomonas rhizosphaerae]
MKLKHSISRGSFIRLRQEGRTEQVVRRMIEAIDLGLYVEGQQLPSETELANQFGVATVTLREALGYLRQVGVIETRRGRNGGSFVCATEEISVELMLDRLDEWSVIELRDLGDEHMAIAGTAARLAAKRATPDSYQHMAYYIESLGQARNRRERRRADARFHIEIAAHSQSVRLTHAEIRLQSQLGEWLWLDTHQTPDTASIQKEHQAILEAIQQADADSAGARAEAHVMNGIRRLIAMKIALMEKVREG